MVSKLLMGRGLGLQVGLHNYCGLTWSTHICSHCGRTILFFITSHKTGVIELNYVVFIVCSSVHVAQMDGLCYIIVKNWSDQRLFDKGNFKAHNDSCCNRKRRSFCISDWQLFSKSCG